MKDPRKGARTPTRIPVTLCGDPRGSSVKGEALVVDLSSQGLGFETEAELKKGDLLFLKVFLPISFACQVRHVKSVKAGYRCGAKIERIGFLDKLKLKDFVKGKNKVSSGGPTPP